MSTNEIEDSEAVCVVDGCNKPRATYDDVPPVLYGGEVAGDNYWDTCAEHVLYLN